jgi:hypothetical protein
VRAYLTTWRHFEKAIIQRGGPFENGPDLEPDDLDPLYDAYIAVTIFGSGAAAERAVEAMNVLWEWAAGSAPPKAAYSAIDEYKNQIREDLGIPTPSVPTLSRLPRRLPGSAAAAPEG